MLRGSVCWNPLGATDFSSSRERFIDGNADLVEKKQAAQLSHPRPKDVPPPPFLLSRTFWWQDIV